MGPRAETSRTCPGLPTTGFHSSVCTCLGCSKNGNCSPWDKLQSGAMAKTAVSQQTYLIYLEVVPPRDNHKWHWWDLFSSQKICPRSCMTSNGVYHLIVNKSLAIICTLAWHSSASVERLFSCDQAVTCKCTPEHVMSIYPISV